MFTNNMAKYAPCMHDDLFCSIDRHISERFIIYLYQAFSGSDDHTTCIDIYDPLTLLIKSVVRISIYISLSLG